MTDETVDCFNCGRPNPAWAQVCRSCGVALRHGEGRIAPAGPLPTDRNSLISMGAVIATIFAAVLLGLFVSSLNPTDPTVGQPTPSPTGQPVSTPVTAPSATATPSPTPEATATPAPLRGTLAFGTGLDDGGQITGETDTFTPSDNFAYALSIPGGLGRDRMRNEVTRTGEDSEPVTNDRITVDPNAETIAYNLGSAANFVRDWGPGEYVWRIYSGGDLIAEQTFRLAEG